ncbi:MAG: hypothetical protein PHF37_08375 [Phycisphaerae bacterium]|nr:hypothetical protein [Phycisphaerae bacterium]
MFNVFESPWAIIIAAIIVQIILWIAAGFMSSQKRWLVWVAPALIIAAAFALDYFVKTDNEQINSAVAGIVKAGENENCPAIANFLSTDYRDSFHASKESFMQNCNKWLNEPFIEKAVKRQVSLEHDSSSASAVYTVRVLFDKDSFVARDYHQVIFSKIRFELKKQSEKWSISQIELLEIDMQPAEWNKIGI